MALSSAEQARIKSHLKRDPSPLEQNIFENLWSEHCSYRHSKSFVTRYQETHRFGAVGIGENAGGVVLPNGKTVFFKIESHNHPSFIEPREGAATGVGGILRDIFAMGAHPIMLGDLLCFGLPENDPWMKHLIKGVTDGISSYGNAVGISNAGGDTKFHSAFQKNILVNVFALGLCDPGQAISSKIDSQYQGKTLQLHVIGGRTGCDGIGGAAMASETFSGSGTDKKRHHVQIGDPYMEKRIMDICLELRPHLAALQDCGAAGLTSSLFEVCHKNKCGAVLHLDRVPLRNKNLNPEEIMVSESQERMVLIAPEVSAHFIQTTCERWDVPQAIIGEINFDKSTLDVFHKGNCLSECDVEFMVDGHQDLYSHIQPQAKSLPFQKTQTVCDDFSSIDLIKYSKLLVLSLNHADRHWIYNQYDHHVGGRTLISPSEHPVSIHLAEIDISSNTQDVIGVRLSQSPELFQAHPYVAAWQSVREGLTQLRSSGLSPLGVTNGLNFASPEDPAILQSLDEATLGLKDACVHFEVPMVSGNVSLYNQSENKAILPTVALGFVGAGKIGTVLPRVKSQKNLRLFQLTSKEGLVLRDPKQGCDKNMLMDLPNYESDLKSVFESTAVMRCFTPNIKPIWDSLLQWMLRGLPRKHVEIGKKNFIDVDLKFESLATILGLGYGTALVVVPDGVKIKPLKHITIVDVGTIKVQSGSTQCKIAVGNQNYNLDLKILSTHDKYTFEKSL
jgi:phosphoribosylformylglycinamidine synthase subunit PurL